MENTENLDLDIDIEDIGTILKSSRLKQKKTMEEISTELCIRKIYLTALEEGDYETLPPVPYGVGYVRTYARYLGLNPERAVKLYKAASVVEEVTEEDKNEVPEVNKSNNKHIIAGVLALAMIYGGWSLYASSTTSKTGQNSITEEIIIEDVQNEAPLVNVEKDKTSETKSEVTAENVSEETTDTTIAETPVAETQKNKKETPVIEKDKAVIEFIGESWAELKDKNKVYFQGVFHKGEKKEIDYIDNLFLSVGRPQNIKIYIKGVEKNIVSKKRKMNIPLDSLN